MSKRLTRAVLAELNARLESENSAHSRAIARQKERIELLERELIAARIEVATLMAPPPNLKPGGYTNPRFAAKHGLRHGAGRKMKRPRSKTDWSALLNETADKMGLR